MPARTRKSSTTRKPAETESGSTVAIAEKPTAASLYESITLVDAEPEKGKGGQGRPAERNYWVTTILDLAKTNAIEERTTKGFSLPYSSQDEKDAADRLLRQLTSAGTPNDTQLKMAGLPLSAWDDAGYPNGVTVRVRKDENDGNLAVKFWLIEKISRERKPKKDTGEVSSEG